MEIRNVTLTLEKAKEFYNSGNDTLKEVALQAFTQEELTTTTKYTNIKTFEDACRALGMSINKAACDLNYLTYLKGGLGEHLRAIYKLDIIRKALNGADWKPKMVEGDTCCGWVRFYKESSDIPSNKKIIGTFIADGQKYLLVGGFQECGSCDGLCGYEWGYSSADLGLLCCKSKEIAMHLTKYFGKIVFDAIYGQYRNYKWI